MQKALFSLYCVWNLVFYRWAVYEYVWRLQQNKDWMFSENGKDPLRPAGSIETEFPEKQKPTRF